MKRKFPDNDTDASTPRKLRTRLEDNPVFDPEFEEEQDVVPEMQTPSRRKRGRPSPELDTPRKSALKARPIPGQETPKSSRRVLFSTPSKSREDDTDGTPTIVRNADRSARRKSARRLIERAINGETSEDDALEEDEALAQQILSDEEEEADGADPKVPKTLYHEEAPIPETPTKRKRGRPKGSGKKQLEKQPSLVPPERLPPHELYFWQNRIGGTKTSNNILSAEVLLNHDEYFETMQSYQDMHDPEKGFLLELHSRAFDQWLFELSQGFNICLYGYGSKRSITEAFTSHLYAHLLSQPAYAGTKKPPKIIVINGYTPNTTLKHILTTLATALLPKGTRLPNQPPSLLKLILDTLTSTPPPHPIPLILNSLDSVPLRKSPTPTLLAQLASHPSINLLCTVDTPLFPLLWDISLRTQYRFLHHDTTTFSPYVAELDAVETVNELLGRSGRRIGGRDGVGFVLRSLPENARSLFRILVTEQLALMLDDMEDPSFDGEPATPRNKSTDAAAQGIEYRVLYHKAVEEFVCSSEVGFRTLLKEFHDHQMVESRKDSGGAERLWVPFRQEELEGLAEDLVGEAF
ncbi:ORC2-domain-containing protein [Delitschia confertaspora ATCC 74209]|uniref:Origin recognition complex subunit 2 n=1 Tax=Delitschia confertaspora ATCC 74209 TaxID=1513339 RepID=A0A9P4JKM2_9PLEO|nr:ORC2-domain-containing protein [Delitschia confertaspora ATCC 74209]